MKRVLFVTDHLGGGGAPISILALAEALAKRGCSVTILALQDKIWHEPPEGVDIQVVSFTYHNRWQKLFRYRAHARRLESWLTRQSYDFDLVIANMYYSHQVINRTSLAGSAWLCIRTDPVAALISYRRLKQFFRLRGLYHGRKVLAISRGILDSLQKLDVIPAQCRAIPNIIDADTIQASMRFPVPYEDYIVYVGRIDKRQKRYDRLFEAYRKSGISQKLLVVGDGELEEAKALAESLGIASQLVFLGKQANPYPYIHHARLLVLSSDYEGFGRVIAEALVCGTPVVSTDCPSGPGEILNGDLSRCLVPLDDGKLLGQRLAELLESPPAIRKEHYAAFMPEVVARKYLELM